MKKLTGKTFLLLFVLSLLASASAYGCTWIFLPYADKNLAQHGLEEKAKQLAGQLRKSEKESSAGLFAEFIRMTGAEVCLLNAEGESVSPFTFQKIHAGAPEGMGYPDICKDQEIAIPFRFFDPYAEKNADAGTEGSLARDPHAEYILLVRYPASRSRDIINAMRKSLPYVMVFITALSFGCAWIFSNYTTRPIVRIHKIAEKMAQLDFSWYCPDVRDDEIGMLSKNINELSDKLHAALEELHARNAGLTDELQLEKERERRRMLFFSGVSHELKTPIAVVIGQLEGIAAEVGVYKDRQAYLAKSIGTLQSLNQFIKEILLISHMDIAGRERPGRASLSALAGELLEECAGYAEFYSVTLQGTLEDGLQISAEEGLVKKALGNVIGNAVMHSPEGGHVTVNLCRVGRQAEITVKNAPAHIAQEHLPHVFEAFYRVDASAGHGSGLGLYITGMVLDMYGVSYKIENEAGGVKFTALFVCT